MVSPVLKGAIVGFGEVASHGHWPAYQALSGVEIVAVVYRVPGRRALAEAMRPGIATFETMSDLVAWHAAGARIDFVDICTPPALHFDPLMTAMGAGWHALCEKPFLLDTASLDLVRQRAAETGVAVVPVHNWKYAPIVRRATERLTAGAIGRLRRVEIRVTRLRAAPTAAVGAPNWRRDRAMAGGGILLDHGWHALYLALHWFGESSVGLSSSLHVPAVNEVEDEAYVTVRFPSGEAEIALTWNGDRRSNTMRLEGERGEIVVDDDTLRVTGRSPDVFPEGLSAGSHHETWFAAMLPDVLRAFGDRALAAAAFEEGAECLSIIERAYRQAAGAVV